MGLETTRRVVLVPQAAAAERRFREFLDAARTAKRPAIQLQHNPDPDALASAFALKHLLKRFLRLDAPLVYTGSVGRAENRAMIRYLGIRIVPAFRVDYAKHDLVIVVDTQPGAGTCRVPDGVKIGVVVDHHPTRAAAEVPGLSLVDEEYGATSTLVGEMMIENGMRISSRLATALVYGIQTDTQDLARNVSEIDERVFERLYAIADKRLLARIQRARVPLAYFRSLERGLREATLHDGAVVTHLGEIEHADLVAEVADLLFRLEGTKWSFVTGVHGNVVYLSLRAIEREGADAGAVARVVAGPVGSGGGHEALAGGQIPVGPEEDADAVAAAALARFLEAVPPRRGSTPARLTLAREVPSEEPPA